MSSPGSPKVARYHELHCKISAGAASAAENIEAERLINQLEEEGLQLSTVELLHADASAAAAATASGREGEDVGNEEEEEPNTNREEDDEQEVGDAVRIGVDKGAVERQRNGTPEPRDKQSTPHRARVDTPPRPPLHRSKSFMTNVNQ